MTQLSNNISVFIVHMLTECQMLMNPPFSAGYVELKPNQLNDADWEKLFSFPLCDACYLYTFVDLEMLAMDLLSTK